MLTTVFVVIDRKGDRPSRKGAVVLMSAENESAVTWVRSCCGGWSKKQARGGALMRMIGALETTGGVKQGMCEGSIIGLQTAGLGGKRGRFLIDYIQNAPEFLGRCRSLERRRISCVWRCYEKTRV